MNWSGPNPKNLFLKALQDRVQICTTKSEKRQSLLKFYSQLCPVLQMKVAKTRYVGAKAKTTPTSRPVQLTEIKVSPNVTITNALTLCLIDPTETTMKEGTRVPVMIDVLGLVSGEKIDVITAISRVITRHPIVRISTTTVTEVAAPVCTGGIATIIDTPKENTMITQLVTTPGTGQTGTVIATAFADRSSSSTIRSTMHKLRGTLNQPRSIADGKYSSFFILPVATLNPD